MEIEKELENRDLQRSEAADKERQRSREVAVLVRVIARHIREEVVSADSVGARLAAVQATNAERWNQSQLAKAAWNEAPPSKKPQRPRHFTPVVPSAESEVEKLRAEAWHIRGHEYTSDLLGLGGLWHIQIHEDGTADLDYGTGRRQRGTPDGPLVAAGWEAGWIVDIIEHFGLAWPSDEEKQQLLTEPVNDKTSNSVIAGWNLDSSVYGAHRLDKEVELRPEVKFEKARHWWASLSSEDKLAGAVATVAGAVLLLMMLAVWNGSFQPNGGALAFAAWAVANVLFALYYLENRQPRKSRHGGRLTNLWQGFLGYLFLYIPGSIALMLLTAFRFTALLLLAGMTIFAFSLLSSRLKRAARRAGLFR